MTTIAATSSDSIIRFWGLRCSRYRRASSSVISSVTWSRTVRLVRPSRTGVNKVITSVEFVGQKSAVLKLKPGPYRFYCAPHADEMHGGFRAVR